MRRKGETGSQGKELVSEAKLVIIQLRFKIQRPILNPHPAQKKVVCSQDTARPHQEARTFMDAFSQLPIPLRIFSVHSQLDRHSYRRIRIYCIQWLGCISLKGFYHS